MATGGNQQARHGELKNEILIDLGSRENVLIENTPNGLFRSVKGGRVVRIGRQGMPDIRGTIRLDRPRCGVMIAVEVKTGRGRLTKPQRKWMERFTSLGGLYILARKVDDIHAVIGPPGSIFTLTQMERHFDAKSTSNP